MVKYYSWAGVLRSQIASTGHDGHFASYYIFDADIQDVEAVEICALLFGTVLPSYSDLDSQKAVERVIQRALSKETFLKAFASSLVRTDGSHLSRQECFVLCRWSSLALQALQLPAGLKAAQKLMERQVGSQNIRDTQRLLVMRSRSVLSWSHYVYVIQLHTRSPIIFMAPQVTYLDPLIWLNITWKPIGKAVRATLQKDKALSQAYINLASITGRLSITSSLEAQFPRHK